MDRRAGPRPPMQPSMTPARIERDAAARGRFQIEASAAAAQADSARRLRARAACSHRTRKIRTNPRTPAASRIDVRDGDVGIERIAAAVFGASRSRDFASPAHETQRTFRLAHAR